jgi:hypothetical protein
VPKFSQSVKPGPNPLFFGVLAVVALGILAGALAGDGTLLNSNLVFRIAVGGAVAGAGYIIVVVAWLAWHRRTMTKFGFAGQTMEAGASPETLEITERDLEVAQFMGTATEAIDELRRRVEELERSKRRSGEP